MGVRYCVYVGPFLQCRHGKQKRVEIVRTGCPQDDSHDRYVLSLHGFCPICGAELEEKTITRERLANRDIYEITDGEMRGYEEVVAVERGFDLAVPNVSFLHRNTTFDKSDLWELCLNATPDLIAQETKIFLGRFAGSIVKLQEECGEENVGVSWGVLGEID